LIFYSIIFSENKNEAIAHRIADGRVLCPIYIPEEEKGSVPENSGRL